MDMELLKEFFKWCTILNIVLYMYVALLIAFMSDWIFKVHSKLFSLERGEFNTVLYSFLGLYKIIIIVFNLVPYLVLLIIR